LYNLEEGSKKSSRNSYEQNCCNYGKHGFSSLNLSPLYHHEEGSKKLVEKSILKIVIMAEMDLGTCI